MKLSERLTDIYDSLADNESVDVVILAEIQGIMATLKDIETDLNAEFERARKAANNAPSKIVEAMEDGRLLISQWVIDMMQGDA